LGYNFRKRDMRMRTVARDDAKSIRGRGGGYGLRFPDPDIPLPAEGYTPMKELPEDQIERIRPGMPMVRR
jgi:hypothetical protein